MSDLPPTRDEHTKPADVTELLRRGALDEAAPLIYKELERSARGVLQRFYTSRKSAATLQTASLVNRLYLSMVGKEHVGIKSRREFYALASSAMMNLLRNYERARRRQKRGGGYQQVALLDDLAGGQEITEVTLEKFDEALLRLEQLDERQALIIRLHYVVGCSIEETAELVGVSIATVNRDLKKARLWLTRALLDSAA